MNPTAGLEEGRMWCGKAIGPQERDRPMVPGLSDIPRSSNPGSPRGRCGEGSESYAVCVSLFEVGGRQGRGPEREKAGGVMMGPSLGAMVQKIQALGERCIALGLRSVAGELDEVAAYLAERHDHTDPCDPHAACPCRKAESEEPPTAPYKHKEQPTWPGLHVSGGP